VRVFWCPLRRLDSADYGWRFQTAIESRENRQFRIDQSLVSSRDSCRPSLYSRSRNQLQLGRKRICLRNKLASWCALLRRASTYVRNLSRFLRTRRLLHIFPNMRENLKGQVPPWLRICRSQPRCQRLLYRTNSEFQMLVPGRRGNSGSRTPAACTLRWSLNSSTRTSKGRASSPTD